MVRAGATAFANSSAVVMEQADIAIDGIEVALARADATVEELRVVLERARENASNRAVELQARVAETSRELAAARRRRDEAREAWDNTPLRERRLRNLRFKRWTDAGTDYAAVAARFGAQSAALTAAKRVLDALPPVDRNLAVMTATAAARAIRNQLVTAKQNLETLRAQHEALVAAIAQGGTLLAINLAEVNADLEALRSGQAVSWRLTGTFVNEPFDVSASLDFSEPAAAAGALLAQLIQR
jgi:hypothetical protein